LALNHRLTGSRYIRGFNSIGGVRRALSKNDISHLNSFLRKISKDFNELETMLYSSVSFMDRVDSTGVLKKKTAEDLGIVGLPARASGIPMDLRKDFPGIYEKARFNPAKQAAGDVSARLKVRVAEFRESVRVIKQMLEKLDVKNGKCISEKTDARDGYALGYAEGWRGPVLYWVRLNPDGTIERCKIVDPSFHNWQGLSFAVLGNIIPDFPLCNKSFDLSYSGNDL